MKSDKTSLILYHFPMTTFVWANTLDDSLFSKFSNVVLNPITG